MANGWLKFRSKQFVYDGKLRQFAAEASSLGWAPDRWALDFEMISDRTGATQRFALAESRHGPLGLSEVVYKPLDKGLDCSVVIFND